MNACKPRYAQKLSAILQKLQDTAQELEKLWLASLSGAAISIDPCFAMHGDKTTLLLSLEFQQ
jgi:hypothetical protein